MHDFETLTNVFIQVRSHSFVTCVVRRSTCLIILTHTNVFIQVRSHSGVMCVVRRLATPVAVTDTNAHSMMYTVKMHLI